MRQSTRWQYKQLDLTPDRLDMRSRMEGLAVLLVIAGWLVACLVVGVALHGLAGAL